MNGAPSHSSNEEGDKRRVSHDSYPEGWTALRSVVGLVPLQILAVQLLLGFVELSQLLGLAFAQLLPFCVMSGETLQGRGGVLKFVFGKARWTSSLSRFLPSHRTWSTCPCLCGTFHTGGSSSWPVWPSGTQ